LLDHDEAVFSALTSATVTGTTRAGRGNTARAASAGTRVPAGSAESPATTAAASGSRRRQE